MQKAAFAITILHIASRLYLQSLHFLQRPNHTSGYITFQRHETFQIDQSNLLISDNTFVQGL